MRYGRWLVPHCEIAFLRGWRRWASARHTRFGHLTLRLGPIGIGFNLPKQLHRWLTNRAAARYAAEMERFYVEHPEEFDETEEG